MSELPLSASIPLPCSSCRNIAPPKQITITMALLATSHQATPSPPPRPHASAAIAAVFLHHCAGIVVTIHQSIVAV